jgi:hypothetical protein
VLDFNPVSCLLFALAMYWYFFSCRRIFTSSSETLRIKQMTNRVLCLLVATPILLAGCASGQSFQQSMQPEAVQMAVRRGAFEMNCPAATGEVLSSENVEPVSFRFGVERVEYTVGVSGCGKRTTYVVLCPDNGSGSCFTGASRNGIQTD